jgi:hypothetical protein
VQRSFNAISIDGDMSTNDTVVLFANGAGANEVAGGEFSARKTETETEIDETRASPAFNFVAMSPYDHYCFLQHIRSSASPYVNPS